MLTHSTAQLGLPANTIQNPLPREWCLPQWAHHPTSVEPLTDICTGEPNLDNPSLGFFLCIYVSTVNTNRSRPNHPSSQQYWGLNAGPYEC